MDYETMVVAVLKDHYQKFQTDMNYLKIFPNAACAKEDIDLVCARLEVIESIARELGIRL